MNRHLTYFNKTILSDNSVQYVLRICGVTIWASLHSKSCSWVRIFGKGLMWKHVNNGLTFSERHGYKKYLRVCKWIIEIL